MDVSELRKRILHALDDARREAATRRDARMEAERDWKTFLAATAVPMFRQAADVLRAEGRRFSVQTPESGVRLSSDADVETFLELDLDLTGLDPAVVGRVSVGRGKGRQDVRERSVAPGKSVPDLTEADLAAFLVAEVPKLIVRP